MTNWMSCPFCDDELVIPYKDRYDRTHYKYCPNCNKNGHKLAEMQLKLDLARRLAKEK